jgi:hypothetical protein
MIRGAFKSLLFLIALTTMTVACNVENNNGGASLGTIGGNPLSQFEVSAVINNFLVVYRGSYNPYALYIEADTAIAIQQGQPVRVQPGEPDVTPPGGPSTDPFGQFARDVRSLNRFCDAYGAIRVRQIAQGGPRPRGALQLFENYYLTFTLLGEFNNCSDEDLNDMTRVWASVSTSVTPLPADTGGSATAGDASPFP